MSTRSFDGKRVLITGISGFGGSWLAETILKNEKKAKIFGLKRETTSTQNNDHIIKELKLIDADITDKNIVFEAVEEIDPQIVFHLAAISSSVRAEENPKATEITNVGGTKNLLDALAENASNLEIFHFASSSSVYKKINSSVPINEKHPLGAHDIYSESKIKAEKICNDYSRTKKIPVIITRAFNQGGPRCREDIVANKIAKSVVSAKKDGIKEFVFGNVNSVRDFIDVRDVVEGYWLAAKKGVANSVYNLCSERGIRILDMIDMSLDYVGLSKDEVKIVVDKKFLRRDEADVVIGDNSKARKELSWKPKIPFEQTLKEMIDNYLSASD